MKTTVRAILLAAIVVASVAAGPLTAQTPGRGRVYIILWLITDDSQMPQADAAAKRLAVCLTQQGIRATFLVSAEKAHALEQRNREDVIGALAQHDIGYYSERFGQPEPGASPGAVKSREEWVRRDREDLDEVRRLLGQAPACYGGVETPLAPALYATLQKWGMKLYFHQERGAAGNGKPYRYEGLLNIFTSRETQQLRPDSNWSNLAEARARFQDFRFRVSSRREGTLLNLWFRPSEFVQQASPAKERAAGAGGNHAPLETSRVRSPEDSE